MGENEELKRDKNDGSIVYKKPEPKALEELDSLIGANTDIRPSAENSRAAQLFKERLDA